MRAKSIITILLLTVVAIPAMAQDAPPWEVRPYLSTYTDDATHTWNFTSTRHRFMCPLCGYSMTPTDLTTVASDYTCPDPFNTGHPATELDEGTPRQRVLSRLALQAENWDGSNLADADTTNDYALVGRPFHPGSAIEPEWNAGPSPWEDPAPENVGSYLTLRAADLDADGLISGNGTAGNSDGLRFMVIDPGSVRPSAQLSYFNDTDTMLAPGTPVFHRSTVTSGAAGAGAGEYIIHVNPYRVSDGDTFYIWHHESCVPQGAAGFRTNDLEIEVYSTLYGEEFDNQNFNAGQLGNYYSEEGCEIITDSGALRVEIPRQFGATGEGWFLLKVQIHSNTTILPRHEAVNYNDVTPGGPVNDIYDDPAEVEPAFGATLSGQTAGMPEWKESFVYANTTASPVTLATADVADGEDYPVALKDTRPGSFETTEIWPYRMPPAAAGTGRVMLQWSDAAADADLNWDWQTNPGAPNVYFRTGREWFYLVDPVNPSDRLVTNELTAAQADLPDEATFIDSRFMCSRMEVPFTGDNWAATGDPAETDTEAASGGFARVILGDYWPDPATSGYPDVGYAGEYAPGSRTPGREFALVNRTPLRVLECPVEHRPGQPDGCGARYALEEPVAYGDSQLDAGDACPACGGELVAARGEANVQYDAQDALTAEVAEPTGTVLRRMTPEALEFGLGGAMVPIGAPDFAQEVLADIPDYQAPSVPAGATGFFSNDLANDWGYRGTMLAFNRPAGDAAGDANGDWDAYYLSPTTGERFLSPPSASNLDAEWFCNVCGSPWDKDLTDGDACPYCGDTLSAGEDLPVPRVTYDALVAEEYDPFGVQLSVVRETQLASDQDIADLGWVAPGRAGADEWPTDVSERSEMAVRNEGNIETETQLRSAHVLQTGVDRSVRSYARWGQSVPITLETLFPYHPGPGALTSTLLNLEPTEATGAAGETTTALLQAGVRALAGEPYAGTEKPVPLGQPIGNYGTEVLLFVDLDGDDTLDFYDTQTGATNRPYWEFDPGVDEPYEPVSTFAPRARVTETRLPTSDLYSQDLMPTLLHDPNLENLQVLWAGQRAVSGGAAPVGTSTADVPPPTAPYNVLYDNAELNDTTAATDDPLYRGWLWTAPPANALTEDIDGTNTAPTAYRDEDTNERWAVWHRSMAGRAGATSRLQFAVSGDADWAADPNNYIFGSGGAHSGLTGFTRSADAHWLIYSAGPVGREHLRYRPEWDPDGGVVPDDRRLMVTNSSAATRSDFFVMNDARYRKPALNPFSYVKQGSAWGTDATGEFVMDVVFTGHLRHLGNSDICWTRFNFGDPTTWTTADQLATADDNFAKVTFPRVVGTDYEDTLNAPADARGMPAVRDADGDVRGFVGEQLTPSPRRQSYQARDIDWLVTVEKEDPLAPDAPFNFATKPDWTGWEIDGTDPGMEAYEDPKFYVGVVTDDGTTREEYRYAVDWSRGGYDASSGLYRVVPRLIRMTPGGLAEILDPPAAGGPPVWHPRNDTGGASIHWRDVNGVFAKSLLAPSARGQAADLNDWADPPNAQTWPAVTLTINPATGLLQWSAPLFNPDNPFDSRAIFNANNTANIVDVVMYADYTPFIRRVTTDSADDDAPSAYWNQADSGRNTFFWRRSYSDTDTPHFGRPSFMHRSYTRALHVGHPAINSIGTVRDMTLGEDLVAGDTFVLHSDRNGVIIVEPTPETSMSRIGHRIAVTYTDATGTARTDEYHRVLGWSLETPVPVNTVTSEGPLRVIPETYVVDPDGSGGSGDEFDTVRYWLVWASPRGVYDTRTAGDGGQRVHQSSDVYLAVVAPDYHSLIADLEVPRLEP